MEQRQRSSLGSSPYQSLGDRPEMELDLWEGQFKLGDQEQESGLDDDLEEYTGHYTGATCWGEDSSVNMGTVSEISDDVFNYEVN